MIIAADLHLREDTVETVTKQVLPGLLEAAVRISPPKLAVLGDIWHLRYRVPVVLQNLFHKFLVLADSMGVEVILLPGNHDQVNPNGENALQVFSDLPNVRVYNGPVDDEHGLWLPYRKDTKTIYEWVSRSKSDVIFMHQGVYGAVQNSGTTDQSDLTAAVFKDKRIVISGHYHLRHKCGNVVYIGSPYQTRADEAYQTKGFASWDGQNLEFEDKKWGKCYYKYALTDVTKLAPDGARPEDELRIEVLDPKVAEAAGKALAEKGFQNVAIHVRELAPQQRLVVTEDSTDAEYAQAYVRMLKPKLDEKRLMDVYCTLTGETR